MRITLKRAFADGTLAVDRDPLSLLYRLATSVPHPRYHIVKYVGVLALASRWRARSVPAPPDQADEPRPPAPPNGYRPWAELLARTFALDVLTCCRCQGRLRLVAMLTEPASVEGYLAGTGEAAEVPPTGRAASFAAWRSATSTVRRGGGGDDTP